LNYTIEIIRLVAVVLITFTHIRHNFTEGPMYYMLEVIPKYGTLILSLVSGYLYNEISSKNVQSNLTIRKIKSLLIPYLIANVAVLLPVLTFKYFGFNFLNRLSFDYTLFTEGLLSLNSAPINPPTYFIRDLFVIFLLVDLFRNKNFWTLIAIIPLLFFGKILLRVDILVLFIIGNAFSMFREYFNKYILTIALTVLAAFLFIFNYTFLLKYTIVVLLFINVMRLKIDFVKTGGFTYLLHLYHSPIIVFLFPLVNELVENSYLKVFLQIFLVLTIITSGHLILKKLNIRFLTGGR